MKKYRIEYTAILRGKIVGNKNFWQDGRNEKDANKKFFEFWNGKIARGKCDYKDIKIINMKEMKYGVDYSYFDMNTLKIIE